MAALTLHLVKRGAMCAVTCVAACLMAGLAPAAAAHPLEGGTAEAWLAPWRIEPWVAAALVLSAALYALGARRLWQRAGAGRGLSFRQAAAFAGGWLVLAAALASPLDALGAWLFSAHMLQHELMMVLAAPLLVLGRPLVAWTWALPRPARRAAGRWTHHPAWARPWRWSTSALGGGILHGVALWAWHVPAGFNAALLDNGVHTAQHASFLASALLFWWAALGAPARAARGAALMLLFITMSHTAALGALLTLSPQPWYEPYLATAPRLGIDPLQDQQLGGIVMWVPAGLTYVAGALAVAAGWFRPAGPPLRAPA